MKLIRKGPDDINRFSYYSHMQEGVVRWVRNKNKAPMFDGTQLEQIVKHLRLLEPAETIEAIEQWQG